MDRRSEALAQLLESALSERFAAPVVELLGALPMPLAVVHGVDLRLVAANPAMYALLRRPQEEVLGSRLSDLLPPIHPLDDPGPLREVAAGSPAVDRAVTIDGRAWRWFVRSLRGGEEGVDYLITGLVETVSPDEAGVAWLLETNAAKTDFLNLAAHELRTPLGVIHGYGSLLAQGELSAEHQRLAGLRVYEKARQLSRLIADMTLLARFDELGPGLSRAPVDLRALVEGQVEDVRRKYPDLAIELLLEAKSATVLGNQDWLRVAVRELLDNAARFRRQAAGRIDVELAQIDGEVLTLTVVDDGFGIDEQEQSRLFRRFSRVETDDNRHLVGLGIGLYLVLEIAQAHGGEIALQSRSGQGSEFRLTLPSA
jgi:signal transduction histidine kinase